MKVSIETLITDIEHSESGPEIVAFFDFDRTLIAGYSVTAFMTEHLKSGEMSASDIGTQARAAMRYSMGNKNFSELIAQTAKTMKGEPEQKFEELGEKVHRKKLAGAIYPEARALLDAHRAKGHTIAIVSSATKYQIMATARELDIEHVLYTKLEVEDGYFTGEAISPTCFGTGKLIAAQELCDELDADLTESFFYTDSIDDLPLLKEVAYPRPVNADKQLTSVATTHGWLTCDFAERSKLKISQIARTGAIFGAIPGTMLATAPYQLLTGKKRSALNAGMSIWADLASALAGLTYDVKGEQYLWEKRPAVFIFNHQSSVDTIILARLLRRDFTGIGKKQIERFPVIGQVLKYSDMIFIDRSSTEKAIQAMAPVVEAMHRDGLSVCLAPEGTRSDGRKLGQFKKGAFHIAMQAGVPIVPIVIHNASDSLPKSRNIARPAQIRVTVLKPISTKKWKKKTLDTHIEKVRNKFLKTLGQAAD